jgi:hypothetical protein
MDADRVLPNRHLSAEIINSDSASVVSSHESKQTRYPLTDCALPVTIEFRMTVNRDGLDTHADKAIEGAVFLEVRFRHATDDPQAEPYFPI